MYKVLHLVNIDKTMFTTPLMNHGKVVNLCSRGAYHASKQNKSYEFFLFNRYTLIGDDYN